MLNERRVGRVERYDPATRVAAVEIEHEAIRIGDLLHVAGGGVDAVFLVSELAVGHEPAEVAPSGSLAEIRMPRDVPIRAAVSVLREDARLREIAASLGAHFE
ncbi:MAG: hypothetical protein ACT4PT_00285 [Methanobacteriota archaeon]